MSTEPTPPGGAATPTFAHGTRAPNSTTPVHHAPTSMSEVSMSPTVHHHTAHRFGALRNVELVEGKEHSTARPFRLRNLLG